MRPKKIITPKMLGTAAQCKHRYKIEYVDHFRRRKPDKNLQLKQALAFSFMLRDSCIFKKVSRDEMFDTVIVAMEKCFPVDERAKVLDILSYYDAVRGYCDDVFFAVDNEIPGIGKIVEYKIGWNSVFACNVDRIEYDKGEPLITVRHFTSSNDRQKVERELSYRLDTLGQLWAISCIFKKPALNVRYEIIRTKSPAIPRAITCKPCKGSGLHDNGTDDWPKCEKCLGTGVSGISSGKCDTTAQVWESVLDKYPSLDREAVLIDHKELLDALRERGDVFVYETRVSYTREQLTEWRLWMQAVIGELRTCAHNKFWQRNVYACSRNGRVCPYARLCSGKAGEDEATFYKVEERYPGLYDFLGWRQQK